MFSLEDLAGKEDLTLADVQPEAPDAPLVSNKASNTHLGVQAAVLSDEDPVQTYRQVDAELTSTGVSPTYDKVAADSRAKSVSSSTESLNDILLDPALSDEQKQAAISVATNPESPIHDMTNAVATKSLASPSEDETYRSEELRSLIADQIGVINKQKFEEQKLYNQEMNKKKPSFVGFVADMAESLVPFDESLKTAIIAANATDGSSVGTDIALQGNTHIKIREAVAAMPPDKRLEFQRHLVNVINESGGTVFQNDNDLQKGKLLADVLQQGEYTDGDKNLDNIMSLLDMTLLGGAIFRGAKAAGATTKMTEAGAKVASATKSRLDNFYRRLITSEVQPSSVAQVYKDTNATSARAAYSLVVNSEGDEAAQAMYGTTKADVLTWEHFPMMLNEDGSVISKVADIDRTVKKVAAEDELLIEESRTNGRLDLMNEEKDSARAAVLDRFMSVDGLTARKGMFQTHGTSEGMNLRAVYGPTEGGFTSAEEALSTARVALRDEGISEDAIKLMIRKGQDYVVATPEELNSYLAKDIITHEGPVDKDYLISVDHAYEFKTSDIMNWGKAEVTSNWAARVLPQAITAKLWPNLMDRASMFGKETHGAASAATDAKSHLVRGLVTHAKEMADLTKKTTKANHKTMLRLLKEANVKGIVHPQSRLIAEGLTPDEIKAMGVHRKFWDTSYQLENASRVKDMEARGIKEVVDETTKTKLFAKPVHVSQAGNIGAVYDMEKGTSRAISEAERKALYEQGGTLAKLDDPIILGDTTIEHVLVHNKPGRSYAKALSKDTQALHYRKGYYKTAYKDPHFIIKVYRDAKGAVLGERAVATAEGVLDARNYAKSLASKNGGTYGKDFYERPDMKGANGDNSHWQVEMASGRSAQRMRGAPLEAVGELLRPELSNIEDPITSMISAARSVASHTAMRDVLETSKMRFMKRYEKFLDEGPYKQARFPDNIDEIKYRGKGPQDPKELADALATHEYIKYLEDGYGNTIDDLWKSLFIRAGETFGEAGFVALEKGATAISKTKGPVSTLKGLAFFAYLGTSPLRQFVVQSHQALQLVALFPKYVASGKLVPQTTAMAMKQLGLDMKFIRPMLAGTGWSEKEFEATFKAFQKTGQAASIDSHAMIKGSILDYADSLNASRSKLGKAWKLVSAPLTLSRKIGFDSGEYVTTVTSWLAHQDKAIKEGLDVSRSDVAAEVAVKSRNFTYNMNSAGDMRYNQGSLSFIFQFMQVPHKVMTTMLTNRYLTPAQKTRLFTFNAVMYSLPPAAMYSWFGADGLNILPKDPTARQAVVEGLEPFLLNQLLSGVSQQNVDVDWSSLSPLDPYGMMDFVHGMVTTDIGELVVNSPSGQLFGGNSPRITNAIVEAARYFHVIDDDLPNPATFGSVVKKTLDISSGMSNAYKSRIASELGRRAGQLGESNGKIGEVEAWMMTLGFNPMSATNARYNNDKVYQTTQDFKEDAQRVFKMAAQNIVEQDASPDAAKFALEVQQTMVKALGDSQAVRQEFDRGMRTMYSNKDMSLMTRILRNMSAYSTDQLQQFAGTLAFDSEQQRQDYLKVISNEIIQRPKEEQ